MTSDVPATTVTIAESASASELGFEPIVARAASSFISDSGAVEKATEMISIGVSGGRGASSSSSRTSPEKISVPSKDGNAKPVGGRRPKIGIASPMPGAGSAKLPPELSTGLTADCVPFGPAAMLMSFSESAAARASCEISTPSMTNVGKLAAAFVTVTTDPSACLNNRSGPSMTASSRDTIAGSSTILFSLAVTSLGKPLGTASSGAFSSSVAAASSSVGSTGSDCAASRFCSLVCSS